MSQFRRIKLWIKYTHVFECMVRVVSSLFVEICLLFTLSNMIVLWSFSVKSVFRKMEWQWEIQKKSEKRELGKDKWYNQMGQVGTGWSMFYKEDRDRGVSILGGTGWDWDRGFFRLGGTGWDSHGAHVSSAEPVHLSQSGTTRPCTSEFQFRTCFRTRSGSEDDERAK